MPAVLPQTAPGVPHEGLDPSVAELEAIRTVADIGKWLSMSTPLMQALSEELGSDAPKLRDIVFIGNEEWQDLVKSIKLPVGDSTRPLKPLEQGHCGMLRRIARLRLGLTAIEPQATDASGATTVLPASGSTPEVGAAPAQLVPDTAVKLSVVWDPTLDILLVRMAPHLSRKLFSEYKKRRGAEPVEDIEPTLEQTSAAAQVLAADKAPYVDCAVLGLYGRRLLQKLMYVVRHFQLNGTWKRQELPGPPSFDYWWASYKVLRCIFLLLEVASPEMLDNYGELIRSFVSLYGEQAWFLIYQADVRMRSEHFERLRRYAERSEKLPAEVTYDERKPWATVFHMAIEDTSWWDANLHRPAMLYLTRVKTSEQLTQDGTTQPDIPAGESSMPVIPRSRPQLRSRTRSPIRRRSDQPPRSSRPIPRTSPTESPPWSLPNGPVYSNKSGKMFCDFCNRGTCRHGQEECQYLHACKVCKRQGHGMLEYSKCSGPITNANPGRRGRGGKVGGRGAPAQSDRTGRRA